MRSRSFVVSQRRRALPASETRSARPLASISATARRTAGNALPRRVRPVAAEAFAGPASDFRIFSSVFAPSPGRARRRSCSAAARRSSRDSTPSSDQSFRAVLGPRPGTCITSTRPGGSFARSLASACMSSVSTTSTILPSIVRADAGQPGGLPVNRELRHRNRGVPDPSRRTPVGGQPERVGTVELQHVGEKLEALGELGIASAASRPRRR